MSALTLADAKTHLNITTSTQDAELQDVIDAAEAVVSRRCGPLEPETVTDRLRGYAPFLVLSKAPVVSLISVADVDAVAVSTSSLYLDEGAGIVTYADGATSFGSRSYVVTYEAGWNTLPADLLMAVKEMTRHLWTTQRGGAQRPGSVADAPAPGFLVPNKVAELMEPYAVNVGVA